MQMSGKNMEDFKGGTNMNVKELNRDQLNELKGRYLDEKLYEKENRGASYGELANADEIVSDETIFEEYECYYFSNDDFSCSYGKQSIEELKEQARDSIDYALSELHRITSDIPDSDNMIDLTYFCGDLERIATDIQSGISEYEDAERNGV